MFSLLLANRVQPTPQVTANLFPPLQ
jgi:hypothetical protein